jgi:hypothetical protein
MSRVIVYATDKDGDGKALQVGAYESPYDIRIPVDHFAPDVVLTFEEDLEAINAAHWKRKNEGIFDDEDEQHTES